MTKLPALLAATTAVLLSACSQPADDKAAASDSRATAMKLPASCKDHPLLPAMPELAPVAGKVLTSVDCQPWSVTMVWGGEMDSTEIILVDSQAPDGNDTTGLAKMARTMPLQAAKSAVTMTKGVREMALAYPASLAELGGEDYLSIVKDAPGGLTYALDVAPKDSGGRAGSVVGTIADRYALTININNDTITGISAAEAAYAPWLAALRLNALG